MTQAKKIRSLIFVIAFLLITNIALLLFLLFSRNSEQNKAEPDKRSVVEVFLEDSIDFDKQQLAIYQNLRKDALEKGKPLFDSVKSAKRIFYQNIYSGNISDSVIKKLAGNIGESQIAVDKYMLQYFKSIRRICTPAQLPKFDSSFKTVVEKVTSGRSRRK